MRRNYTMRRSNLAQYYDVEYDFLYDMPHVSRIINHPRKLITVNCCADPYRSEPLEIFREATEADL